MSRGGEESTVDPIADLASCVAACLVTLGEHESGCAQHLRHALVRLMGVCEAYRPAVIGRTAGRPAVEPFLRFLLPEIDRASPPAAEDVRLAIEILRRPIAASSATAHPRFLH